MANAKRDENHVPTLIALLESDGKTIVPIAVNPDGNKLITSPGSSGTDYGDNAGHDQNHITTLIGVSSSDFTTPVAVYASADGRLLVSL